LIPYFIASHPGSDLGSMIDLALYLKRNGYKPDQVQDFIPGPFDIATCMYYTGFDPMTMKPVHVTKHLRDRKLQRALLQFFKPENWFEVSKALKSAGRTDLIGDGCDALIPSRPPRAALESRRNLANREVRNVPTTHPPNHEQPRVSSSQPGYRPHRKSTSTRQKSPPRGKRGMR